MKHKNNAGFSLVEVLVAIVILAAIVIPACTSLVLSHRINEKTDSMLRSQLAVSSAAEALMAEGISEELYIYKGVNTNLGENYGYVEVSVEGNAENQHIDRFPAVLINIEKVTSAAEGTEVIHPYYKVTVTSQEDRDVTITTMIHSIEVLQQNAAESSEASNGAGEGG